MLHVASCCGSGHLYLTLVIAGSFPPVLVILWRWVWVVVCVDVQVYSYVYIFAHFPCRFCLRCFYLCRCIALLLLVLVMFFFIPWWPCFWLQSSLFCSVAASARLGGHFCRHTCVSLHTKLCCWWCVCVFCVGPCVFLYLCGYLLWYMCMHVSFYSHVVSFITNVYLALAWCGVDDGRDCLGALQFP